QELNVSSTDLAIGYRFHLTRRSRPQPAPTNISIEISTTLPMCTMRVKVGRCCLYSILDLLSRLRSRRSSECDPRLHADTARRPNPCDGPRCNHAHCASEHH